MNAHVAGPSAHTTLDRLRRSHEPWVPERHASTKERFGFVGREAGQRGAHAARAEEGADEEDFVRESGDAVEGEEAAPVVVDGVGSCERGGGLEDGGELEVVGSFVAEDGL